MAKLFQSAESPEQQVSRILMLGGIGVDEAKGKLVLNDNGKLDLEQNYDLNQQVFTDIIKFMKLLAQKIGKNGDNSLIIPFWGEESKSSIRFTSYRWMSYGKYSFRGSCKWFWEGL